MRLNKTYMLSLLQLRRTCPDESGIGNSPFSPISLMPSQIPTLTLTYDSLEVSNNNAVMVQGNNAILTLWMMGIKTLVGFAVPRCWISGTHLL